MRKFTHEEIIVTSVVIFCISSFLSALTWFLYVAIVIGENAYGAPLY